MSDTDPVTVCLLGEPCPWARASGGKTRGLFTPAKQRNNAAALRLAAQQEMLSRGLQPFDCALIGHVSAEFGIPASWSKTKRGLALLGAIPVTKRPDLSNILKQIEDALNGVVFRDDALIVRYDTLHKRYSDQPKIVATFKPLRDAW